MKCSSKYQLRDKNYTDILLMFDICMQYFNQILMVVLEVLDDSDSSIRELALSLVAEMLKNQVCSLMLMLF